MSKHWSLKTWTFPDIRRGLLEYHQPWQRKEHSLVLKLQNLQLSRTDLWSGVLITRSKYRKTPSQSLWNMHNSLFLSKGLWTVSAGNICHKGFVWHILALSSPSLIYHSLTAKLSVHWDERGSTRWVQTVAYICDKSWTWWIGSTYAISVSTDTQKKNPAGHFEESAQQLHNRVDYTGWCKLTS